MLRTKSIVIALLFTLLPFTVRAESLSEILALQEEPTGVVVEIMKPSAKALQEHLVEIRDAIAQIHKKFPELPIALVSHGYEQFALTTKNASKYSALHEEVKALTESDIDVHVCGTHASWYKIEPEDYPEFIDVTHTGPAQINDYLNTGYKQLEF